MHPKDTYRSATIRNALKCYFTASPGLPVLGSTQLVQQYNKNQKVPPFGQSTHTNPRSLQQRAFNGVA